MAESHAVLRSLRISPRKVRLVADSIKGLNSDDAAQKLNFLAKKGAEPLAKLLKSAVANASTGKSIEKGIPLYIKSIRVDGGRMFKRYSPRARGRATLIRKKTSHVILVLSTEK